MHRQRTLLFTPIIHTQFRNFFAKIILMATLKIYQTEFYDLYDYYKLKGEISKVTVRVFLSLIDALKFVLKEAKLYKEDWSDYMADGQTMAYLDKLGIVEYASDDEEDPETEEELRKKIQHIYDKYGDGDVTSKKFYWSILQYEIENGVIVSKTDATFPAKEANSTIREDTHP